MDLTKDFWTFAGLYMVLIKGFWTFAGALYGLKRGFIVDCTGSGYRVEGFCLPGCMLQVTRVCTLVPTCSRLAIKAVATVFLMVVPIPIAVPDPRTIAKPMTVLSNSLQKIRSACFPLVSVYRTIDGDA